MIYRVSQFEHSKEKKRFYIEASKLNWTKDTIIPLKIIIQSDRSKNTVIFDFSYIIHNPAYMKRAPIAFWFYIPSKQSIQSFPGLKEYALNVHNNIGYIRLNTNDQTS